MRNVSDRIAEIIETILCAFNLLFFFENCAVYEVMWKKKWYSNTGHR
jgi:hypothetical protein